MRAKVIETALVPTELSPRELACRMTDREGACLSESSVYRILKAADLIESPAYIRLQAADRFPHPTRRRNELWQTDFTYLPVVGWGWYYLSTVLDDYRVEPKPRLLSDNGPCYVAKDLAAYLKEPQNGSGNPLQEKPSRCPERSDDVQGALQGPIQFALIELIVLRAMEGDQ